MSCKPAVCVPLITREVTWVSWNCPFQPNQRVTRTLTIVIQFDQFDRKPFQQPPYLPILQHQAFIDKFHSGPGEREVINASKTLCIKHPYQCALLAVITLIAPLQDISLILANKMLYIAYFSQSWYYLIFSEDFNLTTREFISLFNSQNGCNNI